MMGKIYIPTQDNHSWHMEKITVASGLSLVLNTLMINEDLSLAYMNGAFGISTVTGTGDLILGTTSYHPRETIRFFACARMGDGGSVDTHGSDPIQIRWTSTGEIKCTLYISRQYNDIYITSTLHLP